MKIDIIKLPNSIVEVKGELESDAFNTYIKETTKKFVENAEIQGFRKGAAPEKLVIEKIGEDEILRKSAEAALQKFWPDILNEHNIEALGQAEFHILKLARGNNLVWKATVTTLPSVVLPDYKPIAREMNGKKEKPNEEISDKEVNDTLAYIQKSRSKDGVTPALDDEFAKSLGDFPTLDSLKNNIRDGIKIERERKADELHRMRIANEIADKSTIDVPDLMVKIEIEKMIQELKTSVEQMGLEWSKYLEHVKKTEEEIKSAWDQDAKKRVRVALVLREIAKKEGIAPTEEEVASTTDNIIKMDERDLDRDRVRDYAYGILRNEKVLKLLETC